MNPLYFMCLCIAPILGGVIKGYHESDNIKDEYIILLNKQPSEYLRTHMISNVRTKIQQTLGSASIKDTFSIGSYQAVHVKSSLVDRISALADMGEVKSVIPNKKIHAIGTVPTSTGSTTVRLPTTPPSTTHEDTLQPTSKRCCNHGNRNIQDSQTDPPTTPASTRTTNIVPTTPPPSSTSRAIYKKLQEIQTGTAPASTPPSTVRTTSVFLPTTPPASTSNAAHHKQKTASSSTRAPASTTAHMTPTSWPTSPDYNMKRAKLSSTVKPATTTTKPTTPTTTTTTPTTTTTTPSTTTTTPTTTTTSSTTTTTTPTTTTNTPSTTTTTTDTTTTITTTKSTITTTLSSSTSNSSQSTSKSTSSNPIVTPTPSLTCKTQNIQNIGQWGLSRMMRRNRVGSDTNMAYSHLNSDSGAGVIVYVFDTGINLLHSEFTGRASHFYKADDIREDNSDLNGHGTHVAGLVGGKFYGTAKDVTLKSVKVLDKAGSGSSPGFLKGINAALDDYKAKGKRKSVCNLSLGFAGIVKDIDDLINEAVGEGLPFIVAAGNENMDACRTTPAAGPSVITVGATNREDQLSSFSNYGSCVDILAPGQDILSASHTSNTATKTMSGTSMACPYVTGIVARYLHRSPNSTTPTNVKQWLQNAATNNRIDITKYHSSSTAKLTPNKVVFMQPCHQEPDAGGATTITVRLWILLAAVVVARLALL